MSKAKSNFSRTFKRTLRDAFGFDNIKQTYSIFGVNNAEQAYTELNKEYNKLLKELEKEKEKEKNKIIREKAKTLALEEQKKAETLFFKKQEKQINKTFNNNILKSEFVKTIPSDQVSSKFAISEFSIKFKYVEFINKAIDITKKKYGVKKINESINPITADLLFKKIYDTLMEKSGTYNRIFITNTETGNVISSKLKDDFTLEDFNKVLYSIVQSAGLAVLGYLTFTIQQRNLL